jgi:hypothetical protein
MQFVVCIRLLFFLYANSKQRLSFFVCQVFIILAIVKKKQLKNRGEKAIADNYSMPKQFFNYTSYDKH